MVPCTAYCRLLTAIDPKLRAGAHIVSVEMLEVAN